MLLKNFSGRSDYQSRTGYKQFRLQLAKLLIGNHNDRKRYALPPPMIPARKRSKHQHTPNKREKVKVHYCYNTMGIRHESSIRFNTCNVPLCVKTRKQNTKTCFELLTQTKPICTLLCSTTCILFNYNHNDLLFLMHSIIVTTVFFLLLIAQ